MILGIDHLDIRVKDVDTAINFYCGGLGLRLKRRDGNNAILTAPDGVILEISPGYTDEGEAAGILRAGYLSRDAEGAFRRALDYGAEPIGSCLARSPCGEELEFISCPGQDTGDGSYLWGLFRVVTTAPEPSACAEFYRQMGAGTAVERNGVLAVPLADGRELAFLQGADAPDTAKAYSHVSLLTDDVDAELKKAALLGGKIAHEAYDWSNLCIGFAVGLAGEVVEFFSFYQDGRTPDVFEAPPSPIHEIQRGATHDRL